MCLHMRDMVLEHQCQMRRLIRITDCCPDRLTIPDHRTSLRAPGKQVKTVNETLDSPPESCMERNKGHTASFEKPRIDSAL